MIWRYISYIESLAFLVRVGIAPQAVRRFGARALALALRAQVPQGYWNLQVFQSYDLSPFLRTCAKGSVLCFENQTLVVVSEQVVPAAEWLHAIEQPRRFGAC